MAKRKVRSAYRGGAALQNTRIVIYAMLAFMAFLALLVMISFNSSEKERASTLNANAAVTGPDCAFSALGARLIGPGGSRSGVTVTCVGTRGRTFTRTYSAYDCRMGGSNRYMSQQNMNDCADVKCRAKNMCKVTATPTPTPTTRPPARGGDECYLSCTTFKACPRGYTCKTTTRGKCCVATETVPTRPTATTTCRGTNDCRRSGNGCFTPKVCNQITGCCDTTDQ